MSTCGCRKIDISILISQLRYDFQHNSLLLYTVPTYANIPTIFLILSTIAAVLDRVWGGEGRHTTRVRAQGRGRAQNFGCPVADPERGNTKAQDQIPTAIIILALGTTNSSDWSVGFVGWLGLVGLLVLRLRYSLPGLGRRGGEVVVHIYVYIVHVQQATQTITTRIIPFCFGDIGGRW